ncbi:MAG: GNAT family N-acetyltransferase [Flavobacteriales bacterium]
MNSKKEEIQLLKSALANGNVPLCIPVGNPVLAFLRVTAVDKKFQNKNDVAALTGYRNRFVKSFLTEFNATEAQTSKWLDEYVAPNPSKILFMIDDLNRHTVGYMGIDFIDWDKAYGEADAIVRGENAPKGLMTQALLTLLKWAHSHLGLKTIGVRVLSDNSAVNFYKKMGFEEVKQVPLKKTEATGKVSWVEDDALKSAERYLVHMNFQMNLLLNG